MALKKELGEQCEQQLGYPGIAIASSPMGRGPALTRARGRAWRMPLPLQLGLGLGLGQLQLAEGAASASCDLAGSFAHIPPRAFDHQTLPIWTLVTGWQTHARTGRGVVGRRRLSVGVPCITREVWTFPPA